MSSRLPRAVGAMRMTYTARCRTGLSPSPRYGLPPARFPRLSSPRHSPIARPAQTAARAPRRTRGVQFPDTPVLAGARPPRPRSRHHSAPLFAPRPARRSQAGLLTVSVVMSWISGRRRAFAPCQASGPATAAPITSPRTARANPRLPLRGRVSSIATADTANAASPPMAANFSSTSNAMCPSHQPSRYPMGYSMTTPALASARPKPSMAMSEMRVPAVEVPFMISGARAQDGVPAPG